MWPFPNREWLGLAEAAARANVKRWEVLRAARFGGLKVRISARDLERWIAGGMFTTARRKRVARRQHHLGEGRRR